MKKLGLCAFVLLGSMLAADEMGIDYNKAVEECVFAVDISLEDAAVIDELVTNMAEYWLPVALASKGYFAKLGKKTRYIPSTQFLGYVFTNPKLVKHMRTISNSKSGIKWKYFSKGLKRGLAEEAKATLFDDLPAFAKHTGADEDTLRELALEGKWNDFLKHLLKKH